jgi:hypothetical protein
MPRERKRKPSTSNINVAARSNVVASKNVGSKSSSHGESSKQTVRIRQRDGGTHEESETTRTRL